MNDNDYIEIMRLAERYQEEQERMLREGGQFVIMADQHLGKSLYSYDDYLRIFEDEPEEHFDDDLFQV